jgi:two-component system phosphate regulon sensor histidine kinase PhoR
LSARSWKSHAARLFLSIVLVLLAGWLTGHPGIFFIVALAAYTLWHIINVLRLNRWLQNTTDEIPESLGVWADIFDNISSVEQQNRRQKEQYRAMLDEFRSLTDAFPDATLVIDRNDAITWFNNAAQTLLDLKDPEDIGQAATNLLRGPEFASWLAVRDEVQSRLDMPSPRSVGAWLSASAVSLPDNQRLVILRDITEVHNMDKIRRDFVANISHEMRTPLTVLLGYLELLQQQPREETSDALDRMQAQAVQMRDLLNDLLELSRLQCDEIRSEEVSVNVPAMLSRLKEQAEELSRGNHDLLFDIDAGLHLSGVEADLESAFHNLIVNAVRYTPQRGRVSVSWRDSGEGPQLSVRDSGIGIPKRDIPRLTERFYRVGSDRARQSGGTGLGLAIVKHVLNAHRARLSIESELSEGSEFTCTFPPDRKRTHNVTIL